MYYPKSQITTNLSTNGKEFQIVGKSEYYIGSYFKTSDGKFYTGKTPQDGVNKLLTKNPIVNDKNLEAVTCGVRAETSPRYFININIKYLIYSSDLKIEEAERFVSISLNKYCSVGASLRRDTIVNHSFEMDVTID